MDTITSWLNLAGSRAIDRATTSELLAKLARSTEGTKEYTRTLNKICEGNLLLVYKTVQTYARKRGIKWGSPLSADLLQVGYLGLRHAVSRYDAKKGQLSTIAVPWIRQKIGRHMIKHENPIYIPENLIREVVHLKKTGEVSSGKAAPKNKKLVHLAAYAYATPLSLDKPMGSDGDEGFTLGDLIPQSDTSNSGVRIDAKILELRDLMSQAGVTPQAQDVVLTYIDAGRVVTAAGRLGVTETAVRKTIHNVTAKIKQVV